MPMDPALECLFIHTVGIEPHTGNDVDGKPTFGTSVDYKAKIVMGKSYSRGAGGREIEGTGKVYIKTTTVPVTKDRLTLPTGFTPLIPPIDDVRPHYDEVGLHHVEILIGP